jgi:hypothetical protein
MVRRRKMIRGGRFSSAQLAAAREFRRLHVLAKAGHPDAAKALARAHEQLGEDGMAIAIATVIEGMTAKQVAEARGKAGPGWTGFYAKRQRECLGSLALTFGLARSSGTETSLSVIPPVRGSMISR